MGSALSDTSNVRAGGCLVRHGTDGSTSSDLVGDPPERLDGPGLHEPLHRPANGDALGPDHQGELFMGVVGAELAGGPGGDLLIPTVVAFAAR